MYDKHHIVLDIVLFPSIGYIVPKGNTMKTVKIYMVRKPSDIEEIMELCLRYSNQTEKVVMKETVNLPQVWYDAVLRNPMDNYIFLSGKGGYDDENHRQVLELQCAGKSPLYVAPSGSSYCRYM